MNPAEDRKLLTISLYRSHWGRSRDDDAQSIFINPLLAKKFPILNRLGIHTKGTTMLTDGMNSEDASWRKMSAFQPFVTCIVFEEDETPRGWKLWHVAPNVGHEKGLLMVDILWFLDQIGTAWILGSEDFKEWEGSDSG
jgi:hypothetical protein